MLNRTEIINNVVHNHGYQSYLEIGLGSGANFRAIKCERKVGVDVAKIDIPKYHNQDSDSFFETNTEKFDLIFIDGLHHAEQVERDIVNSYALLNKGGCILIHDCDPWNEEVTMIPPVSVAWTGDVWKAVYGFIDVYGEKIKHELILERSGIFCIEKTGRNRLKVGFLDQYLDWDYFVANRVKYYGEK